MALSSLQQSCRAHRLRCAPTRAPLRTVAHAAARDGEIVVVGGINLDLVLPVPRLPLAGETLSANDLQRFAGGKGANQAGAAGRLGRRTKMVGCVGDDSAADFMLDALRGCGVDVKAVTSRAGVPTGTAIVLLQPGGQNSIIVAGGANIGEWKISPEQQAAVEGASVLLLQREVPDRVNEWAARTARGAGAMVVLDAGGAEGLVSANILRELSVLSPNETELARMTGLPVEDESQALAAAEVLGSEAECDVLVKLGERGSLMLTVRGDVLRQGAFPVSDVVDTTGAGDCFTAAFAASLASGGDYQSAMRYGAAAAALCIQRVGAMDTMPSADGVEQLLREWPRGKPHV